MTNTIIALQGRGGIGKSTTIRLAFDSFIKSSDVVLIDFTRRGRSIDFRAIVDIPNQKIRVGFSSQGDTKAEILKSLRKLIADGCDIIVCASRSRGGPVQAINSFQGAYQIEFHQHQRVAAQPNRNARNLAMASKLVWRIIDVA